MQHDYLPTDDPNHPWNRWLARQDELEYRQRIGRANFLLFVLGLTIGLTAGIVWSDELRLLFQLFVS